MFFKGIILGKYIDKERRFYYDDQFKNLFRLFMTFLLYRQWNCQRIKERI